MLHYRLNGSIIACKNNKYLLVKKPRIHHAWQFPQGGVEIGENCREAALREFKEETGANQIKISKDESVIYKYDWPNNIKVNENLKKFRGQEVHIFLAEFIGNDSDIFLEKNELEKWRWVSKTELEKLIESPEYLKIILKLINLAR